MVQTAFIVGSPRSGTTLLGEILDQHPQIGHWYEPVFVIDYHFQDRMDERRSAEDATDEVKQFIRREFAYFARRYGCQLVIDKNPLNSFKLPFLLAIFPDTKIIHMARDGRDTTLSINVEWNKRIEILNSRNPIDALKALRISLAQQPFLKHKFDQTLFEIGNVTNLFKGQLNVSHRSRRWKGKAGYGPRFAGWEKVIDKVTTIEFNAIQWAACVNAVLDDAQCIPPESFLEVRYETLLRQPEETAAQIFAFLGVDIPANLGDYFSENLVVKRYNKATLHTENFDKWKTKLTCEEKERLAPHLTPTLLRLGYITDTEWHKET